MREKKPTPDEAEARERIKAVLAADDGERLPPPRKTRVDLAKIAPWGIRPVTTPLPRKPDEIY